MIVSMWIGNLFLVILNYPLIGMWVRMIMIPYQFLYPGILVFCAIGVFSLKNTEFDIYFMALFGALGYLLSKLGGEPAPDAARIHPRPVDGRIPCAAPCCSRAVTRGFSSSARSARRCSRWLRWRCAQC